MATAKPNPQQIAQQAAVAAKAKNAAIQAPMRTTPPPNMGALQKIAPSVASDLARQQAALRAERQSLVPRDMSKTAALNMAALQKSDLAKQQAAQQAFAPPPQPAPTGGLTGLGRAPAGLLGALPGVINPAIRTAAGALPAVQPLLGGPTGLGRAAAGLLGALPRVINPAIQTAVEALPAVQPGGTFDPSLDPTIKAYLDRQRMLSTTDAGVAYTFDPATQTFRGATMGGPVTMSLQDMQRAAAQDLARQAVMPGLGGMLGLQGVGPRQMPSFMTQVLPDPMEMRRMQAEQAAMFARDLQMGRTGGMTQDAFAQQQARELDQYAQQFQAQEMARQAGMPDYVTPYLGLGQMPQISGRLPSAVAPRPAPKSNPMTGLGAFAANPNIGAANPFATLGLTAGAQQAQQNVQPPYSPMMDTFRGNQQIPASFGQSVGQLFQGLGGQAQTQQSPYSQQQAANLMQNTGQVGQNAYGSFVGQQRPQQQQTQQMQQPQQTAQTAQSSVAPPMQAGFNFFNQDQGQGNTGGGTMGGGGLF